MKAMKKLGALVLSLAMAITLVVVPGGSAKANSLSDTAYTLKDTVELSINVSAGGWSQDGVDMTGDFINALVPGSVIEIDYTSDDGYIWLVFPGATVGWTRVGYTTSYDEGTQDPYYMDGSKCQITYEQIAEVLGDDVSAWGTTLQFEAGGSWSVTGVRVGQVDDGSDASTEEAAEEVIDAPTFHMFVGLGGAFNANQWDAVASNSVEADATVGDTVTIGLEFDSPVVYTWWVAPTIAMSNDDDITSLDYTIDSVTVDGVDVTSKLPATAISASTSDFDVEGTDSQSGTSYASALRLDAGYNEWGGQYLPINDISTSYTSIMYTITINSINGITASGSSSGSSSGSTVTTDTVTIDGVTYQIVSASKMTAKCVSAADASGKVTIPAKVTIGGESYKVTAIAAKAFKGNKNITSVVVGKNVKKIGKKAFQGCTKIKTINMTKATKIKSVGANAFKNVKSTAKVKVASTDIKKLVKASSGCKATVKVKK